MKRLVKLALLVGFIMMLYIYFIGPNERVAIVEKNGTELYRFDLTQITTTLDYTISDEKGTIVVRVSTEGIGVVEADCPDQSCVHMGLRSHGPQPIVCLPHGLTIRFEKQAGDADFVTGN